MPAEFNFGEISRRISSRIQEIPGEINFRRVITRTGLVALSATGLFGVIALANIGTAKGDEDYRTQKATVEAIMAGRDIQELSLLDVGTFRVVVRRPWDPQSEKGDDYMGFNKTNIGDRALGNALKAVREISRCEVNSVNRLDVATDQYSQFGTFTVTTRC